MATFFGGEYLSDGDDTFDVSAEAGPVTGFYYVNGREGDDTIRGSDGADVLQGGDGDDRLEARANDGFGVDTLLGGDGADTLVGSAGDDILKGDGIRGLFPFGARYDDATSNDDVLDGNGGDDILHGGIGDDVYRHTMADGGQDVIHEGAHVFGPSDGGGDDTLDMTDVAMADIETEQVGDDLAVTSAEDLADDSRDGGVVIDDFFDGGDHVVETLVTADDQTRDLTELLA
jgi:Ca2+-binding RTX toxin-like protein